MATASNIALPKCRRQNISFHLLEFYCTLVMRRKKINLRRCRADGILFRHFGNALSLNAIAPSPDSEDQNFTIRKRSKIVTECSSELQRRRSELVWLSRRAAHWSSPNYFTFPSDNDGLPIVFFFQLIRSFCKSLICEVSWSRQQKLKRGQLHTTLRCLYASELKLKDSLNLIAHQQRSNVSCNGQQLFPIRCIGDSLRFSHIHLLEHFDRGNNTQQQVMKFPLFVLGWRCYGHCI
jgi:hypothetical protein